VAYGFSAGFQYDGAMVHVELRHAREHIRHHRLFSDENYVVSRIVETHFATSLLQLPEQVLLALRANKDCRVFIYLISLA